jgi:hypothetical protein
MIRTTESNISFTREHAGPDVVWLTTDPECKYGHGIDRDIMFETATDRGHLLSADDIEQWDKTRVRITVKLPNTHVIKWRDFAVKHQMTDIEKRALIKSARGGANTWRVVKHPIMLDRWLEIVDRATGQHLWTPRGRRDVA